MCVCVCVCVWIFIIGTYHRSVLLCAADWARRRAVVLREVPRPPLVGSIIQAALRARVQSRLVFEDLAVDVEEAVVLADRDVLGVVRSGEIKPVQQPHGKVPFLFGDAVLLVDGPLLVDSMDLPRNTDDGSVIISQVSLCSVERFITGK